MKMLILNVERISQKNGTTGNKLFPQGDGGQAIFLVFSSSRASASAFSSRFKSRRAALVPGTPYLIPKKLSMVSPELRVPLQSGE